MKQLRIFLLLAAIATSLSMEAQQTKIAYINSQELLEKMPEALAANDKYIAFARELDSIGSVYVNEYQKLVNQIQGDASLSE